jgi:hypothetical protein
MDYPAFAPDINGQPEWGSIALHCTALHCTALHCTALAVTASAVRVEELQRFDGPSALGGMEAVVQCSAVQCSAVQCSAVNGQATVWCIEGGGTMGGIVYHALMEAPDRSAPTMGSMQHYAALCSTIQHYAVLCSTMQYYAAL